jgi:protein-L-isoaspartate(D-aspartate) O-methyltransferase
MSLDFSAARLNMVDSQVRTQDVTDTRIQDAMLAVAREALVPTERAGVAYADAEIPYGEGRWLMRPRDVGKALQALHPQPGERALAIAAPYAAAVLEAMGLIVDRHDQADLLTIPQGPYDVIVCEGAVDRAPGSWTSSLGPDGRLIVVERRGPVGKARLYVRGEMGVGSREAFDCMAPLLPGFDSKPAFVF